MSAAFFFFNDTATTEIYTLSLHDALPIYPSPVMITSGKLNSSSDPSLTAWKRRLVAMADSFWAWMRKWSRSEEHTSELQSRQYLVCRLLLEKKKNKILELMLYHTAVVRS